MLRTRMTASTPASPSPSGPSATAFFAGVTLLILLARMPFLFDGCGVDADGWRVCNAARHMWLTGEYFPSRFPGFPVQEFLCAPLSPLGPEALNAATALMSALTAGLLALLFRTLGSGEGFWAALAFSFTPAVAVAGASAMDYHWALAFLLAAVWAAHGGRALLAGMLLGLGAGCRPTTLAYAPVLFWLLWNQTPAEMRVRSLATCGASALVAAFTCYLPLLLEFGLGFARYYPFEYPPLLVVLRRGTVDVVGRLGLVAMGVGVLVAAWRGLARVRSLPATTMKPAALTAGSCGPWALGFALACGLYLWVPMEAGYLIPAVPFALLLAARSLDALSFRLICVVLACAAFVGFGRVGVYAGPVLQDRAERRQRQEFAAALVARSGAPGTPALVVYGHGGWLPVVLGQLDDTYFGQVYDPAAIERKDPLWLGRLCLHFHPGKADFARAQREGWPVYYLPAAAAPGSKEAAALEAAGARPFTP